MPQDSQDVSVSIARTKGRLRFWEDAFEVFLLDSKEG